MDCSYLNDLEGLQFMPVKANKKPIYEKWEQTKKKYDLSRCEAVGLVCGEISGNLEGLDIDLKYDLTGALFQEYKNAINEIDGTLLKKLVVQKTVSNGYHFIYRCEIIEGSKKLAQRYTTDEEKNNTYQKAYKAKLKELEGKENCERDATKFAEQERDNDKIRVLLETRGNKGYVACAPTKGYEVIYGSFDKIQTITPEQRNILFSIAYGFNEVVKEFVPERPREKKKIAGLSSFEDYNQRGEVVELLENHGWKAVGKKGAKILMLRPGDSKAEHSGNFDQDKNWFSVFSTSTEFEAQKAYQPYAVFGVLECRGDWSETSRKLYELGFGDRKEKIAENRVEIASVIDLTDDDFSFLATESDYEEYLTNWRTGNFEKGKTTGIPELDKHFLFKEGNLVIVNGIDNVGKSVLVWYLTVLSNVFNGWKWLIFSSENKIGSVVRKLIEFYWCEPIGKMSEQQYTEGKKWVRDNYDIIKCRQELYNYTDILKMAQKAMTRKKYNGLMIDPYNSLKIDIASNAKQGVYEYHYQAASKMQQFGQQNKLSIYLNCHVGTPAARNKGKDGYTKAPQKEDSEMGVMFANKADDFLTVHRITQHDTEWMYTELHVRKIKETETGGRVTPYHKPIDLRMVNGQSGFEQCKIRNFNEEGYNAIAKFHKKEMPPEPKISALQPNYNYGESIREQEVEITAEESIDEPPF